MKICTHCGDYFTPKFPNAKLCWLCWRKREQALAAGAAQVGRMSIDDARDLLAILGYDHLVLDLRALPQGKRMLRLRHGATEAERFAIYAICGIKVDAPEPIEVQPRDETPRPQAHQAGDGQANAA
jgi:hypothetical protein